MSDTFLEIIELSNGDIVLQRSDAEGEPLINIRFSEESRAHLKDSTVDVAKEMIRAAVLAASDILDLSYDGGVETSIEVDILEQNSAPVLH